MLGVLRKGRAARVVIILDLGETLGRGGLDLGIEQQRRIADVIEQAVEA
jgi:Flp pilus assembly CpaE family ATPase